MQRSLLLAFVLLACSSAAPPAAQPVAVTRVPAAPLVAAEPAVAADPTPPQPLEIRFAPSPLTGLATRLVELACAAVEKRPLPEPPFPISPAPSSPEFALEESARGLLQDCSGLEFFALATNLAVAPTTSRQGDVAGVEVVALLTSAGLKVATLELSTGSAFAAEGGMRDVAAAGQGIADAICADRADELLVGEEDRAAIGNDELYEKMERRKPDIKTLQDAKGRLNCGDKLAGFVIGRYEIVARDRAGTVYAFKIKMNADNGVPYLKGNPLVRLKRVSQGE